MKKLLKRLRFIFKIHRSIPFLFDFFRSKEVSINKKLLSLAAIIGYFFLPLDLIPDIFIVFGLVDDVSVFFLILQLIVKMAPRSLAEKYELERLI